MNNDRNINNPYHPDDEIDLRQLITELWQDRWLVLGTTTLFIITAVIFSLSLPNIYQSKALLSPVGQESDMNSTMRSYGGIASLAGINLPSQSSASNSIKALDKLNSLSFFTENILPNIFLPDLMAINSWVAETNTIVYNEKDFNPETKNWIRDFKYPQTQIPSAQESFKVFMNDHLNVSQDQDTGFITIAINHQSPYVAQAWTDLIVRELNNFFRVKDEAEAKAAVNFLNTQIAQTNFAEIKLVIAELIQQKTQQLTLIEVSKFYVFDYIDPPAVMETKAEPQRGLIVILGAIFGSIFGIFISLIRKYIM